MTQPLIDQAMVRRAGGREAEQQGVRPAAQVQGARTAPANGRTIRRPPAPDGAPLALADGSPYAGRLCQVNTLLGSKDERDELKGLRWVLVTNECNLDDEQKAMLKKMYERCPQLKTCHKLKEDFRAIFEKETNRGAAKKRIDAWKRRVKKTGLNSFNGFIGTLENWEEWILNYFSSGKITNGVVEGLNNKIKVIKRRAYGYRNNGNFRQRILVECGG